jgi:hypothetical protein
VTYTRHLFQLQLVYEEVLRQITHDWIQVQIKHLCDVYYKYKYKTCAMFDDYCLLGCDAISLVNMYQCFRGIFCLHYQGRSWGCRQKVSLKHPFESLCLHGIIFQMTVIFIIPAMITSNLNFHPYLSFCYSLIFSKKFSFHNSCLKKGLMFCTIANCQKRHASNKSLKLYLCIVFPYIPIQSICTLLHEQQ